MTADNGNQSNVGKGDPPDPFHSHKNIGDVDTVHSSPGQAKNDPNPTKTDRIIPVHTNLANTTTFSDTHEASESTDLGTPIQETAEDVIGPVYPGTSQVKNDPNPTRK